MTHDPADLPALERVLALALALLTLPVLVATLAASALAYRCSPVFVHERIGRRGQPFRFVKIRTLPPTTERYADKRSIGEERIPAVMRAARKAHLDELPQLWFVVAGRMGLVGPRPEMAALHERIPDEAARERLSVRPGITGLWQISVHCDGLICERVEYDRLYVRHRNPLLDLWIVIRTIDKIVFGRRVQLFDVPAWAIARAPQQAMLPAVVAPPGAAPTERQPVEPRLAALAGH